MNEIETYKIALAESIRLQSHYAKLLNIYDEGKRIQFKDSKEWIDRLKETGKINADNS